MARHGLVMPLVSACCGVVLYLYALPQAALVKPQHEELFALPANVLRVVSGQFKELSANISFLSAHTWLGGSSTQRDTDRYSPQQYAWLHQTLENAVTLDPYFVDPYYLMNSALIWDRYKLPEVNGLIAKGADTRTWDPLLPFFAGFNYYYFLNDGEKSFYYLKQASKRSGGNPFFDSLASRVAYKADKTELAIMYLEEQIREAELKGLKAFVAHLERRLELLKGIREIEVAVESYRKLFDSPPRTINELTALNLLPSIPKEPNGGSYYLDANGKVRSTKDMK